MSKIPPTFKIKVKILKTKLCEDIPLGQQFNCLFNCMQTKVNTIKNVVCPSDMQVMLCECVCVYFCVFLFVRVSLSGQWCWLWCNRATDQPLLLITWRELQSINTTLSQMLQCAIVAVLYIWPLQRMWPKCDQRDLNVWMMKCLPHHCWSPCAICIVHCVIHCAICIVH